MIKPYASYFISYLLLNLKSLENILGIILFGSVAKGEADKKSDIDIFIEIKKKSKTFDKEVNKIKEDFYKSREALLFKSKGIDNAININIGKLEEWKNLENSIEGTGVVLYGNYIPKSNIHGKKYVIFFWDKIGKNRGAFLNRIYGYKIAGKKYTGLIESFGGKKLGKSSIMIPIEHMKDIVKLLDHYKVNSKIINIYY